MRAKKRSGNRTKPLHEVALQMDVVTLFPSFFKSPLQESIMKKAQDADRVEIRVHNLRTYTHDRHKTADDKPFGGGAGMVMKPEPIFECVEAIQKKYSKSPQNSGHVILLDPQGKPMSQKDAVRLSQKKHLILISGHYEGVDQRVRDHLADEEISVGDFITMGGEAPAFCLMEAVVRLIPGVLGNEESIQYESFQSGHLEYPQYTRPRHYRDMRVPDVLVSGNHQEVADWRTKMAQKVTMKKRPDLIRHFKKQVY